MKILVVDDEYAKAESVMNVLSGCEIPDVSVSHVTTGNAARTTLRSVYFDMLIIDLNLPAAVGDKPNSEGGLSLFDMISLDEQVQLPPDVLFVTAKEDLVELAGQKVAERGAELLQYRENSEYWKKILVGRVRYMQQRINRGVARRVDVAIITALNKPELSAILALPYNWSARRFSRDPTSYNFGEVPRVDGNISVMAVHAQRKGMPSSAALAAKVATLFRPKYLVMAGICAGLPGKVGLGDVIVADPAWDWGSGKRAQNKDGSPVFQAAPYQTGLAPYVSQLAETIGDEQAVLNSISNGWTNTKPANPFAIHVGPMASGASVIADETTAGAIEKTQHREVLAIEMEAYAVMAATECCVEPRPIGIAVKSVCDYANTEKNDDWQDYAAYTSAAFVDRLLRHPMLRFDV